MNKYFYILTVPVPGGWWQWAHTAGASTGGTGAGTTRDSEELRIYNNITI